MKARTRLLPIRTALVGALLTIAAINAVRAQFVLPDAQFRETIVRFPGHTGPTLDLDVPESDAYTANHNAGGHTSAISANVRIISLPSPSFSGPVLTIRGNALNSGPNANSFSSASATAEVSYFFRVLADPSIRNIPVILPVEWFFHVNVPDRGRDVIGQLHNGGQAQVRAEVLIRPILNGNAIEGTATLLRQLRAGEGLLPFQIGEFTDAGTEQLRINARNFNAFGEYYRVDLKLSGFASRSISAGNSKRDGTALFDAMLDPIPHVDPAFPDAAAVKFEFSENIVEPSIAPVLRILPRSTPEQLFIEITGRPGQIVTLQNSTDLAAWSDLETLTLKTSTATIEVQTAAPPAKRFFRLQWTPMP